MNKLDTVLLIDDNNHDNFFHEFIIQEADIAAEVVSFEYAEKALDFLQSFESDPVDLIFLDVNMPRMNGFEFLEAYEQIVKDKDRVIIVMLTTSLNPNDQIKAMSYSEVKAFLSKPLEVEALKEVVEQHF